MKMMGMGEYFRLTSEFKDFMFEHLDIHGTTGMFAVCVVTFALTLLLEAMKAVIVYVHLRLNQHPLTYGRTNISINHDRLRLHFAGFFTHTVNILLGYLIMLAVMTYDAYVFIAVILGTGLGYFIFGAFNMNNQIKYAALKSNIYERYDSQAALNSSQVDSLG